MRACDICRKEIISPMLTVFRSVHRTKGVLGEYELCLECGDKVGEKIAGIIEEMKNAIRYSGDDGANQEKLQGEPDRRQIELSRHRGLR